MSSRIDFGAVNSAALAALPSLLERWLPAGKMRGHEYVAGNLRGDPGESLSINTSTGLWADFSTDLKGGDPVSLYAAIRGLGQGDAARELAGELGISESEERSTGNNRRPPGKRATWSPISPVPVDAPPPPTRHHAHGEPSCTWRYVDAEGKLLGIIARFDLPDGSKEVVPYSYATDGARAQWRQLSFGKPRPLYGLDRLAARPGANVVVVEGEKAAAAARALFPALVVVTWPGGSKAVKHADWEPLQGRKIVVWPDADKPGIAAAQDITRALEGIAAGVRWLRLPADVIDGWDAADATWTPDEAMAYLRENLVEPGDAAIADDEEPPHYEGDDYYPPEAVAFDEAEEEDPVRPLGYNHGVYYYRARGTRQVHEITGAGHTKNAMLTLAPLHYWQRTFPAKGGADWDMAANALMRRCERAGIYDPERIRGRGAWYDAGRAVLHLGDQVVVDGEPRNIEAMDSGFVYEAAAPLRIDFSLQPLPVREAVKLREICSMLQWERPISAVLLAGFCVVAPICGALTWRPHIWCTGSGGSGKAQPHSANVLTPSGWSTIGALRPGDYVTTPDNGYARVMAVYPQGEVPIYNVTFSDGRKTKATADHLWKVRCGGQWRLRTTAEMIDALRTPGSSAAQSVAVPVVAPVDIQRNKKTKLPLHPYPLGALLGDGLMGNDYGGHAGRISLTSHDPFIVDRCRHLMPEWMELHETNDPHDFRFGDLSRYGRRTRRLIKQMRLLGRRSNNKFIPADYLRATIDERWELLRGLMDTDGTADADNGTISFASVSRVLAKQVAYLVRSLGGTALVSQKRAFYRHNGRRIEGQRCYRVNIRLRDRANAFALPRKRNLAGGEYQYRDTFYLQVESITPAGIAPASCIAIDHPDRLYVTDDFVVTHNTWIMDHVVRRCLGDTALAVQSETTEAGLRQRLGHDALPIVFDEAESEDQRAQQRVQNVMALMRQASSETGAAILKGSANGRSTSYRIRSCFAFASIGVGVEKYADMTRVSILSLRENRSASRRHDFERLTKFWAETLTEEFVQRLQARSISLIPTIRRNAEVFSAAGAQVLGTQRLGDQVGALLAGAYSLSRSDVIDHSAAVAWLSEQDWTDETAVREQRDEVTCLQHILEHTVRVQLERSAVDRSLGELVDVAARGGTYEITISEADAALLRHGLKVDGETLLISNTATAIARALGSTSWARNWGRILSRLEGAEATNALRFGPGAMSRAVRIPLGLIIDR